MASDSVLRSVAKDNVRFLLTRIPGALTHLLLFLLVNTPKTVGNAFQYGNLSNLLESRWPCRD